MLSSTHSKPTELNFAVVGTGKFSISGVEYVCDDFRIGQGSSGFSNVWWIASSQCSLKDASVLKCKCGLEFYVGDNDHSFMVQSSSAKSGYIQRASDKGYLTCTTSQCSWQSNASQKFRKYVGHDGQSRFHVLLKDGTDSGQCLDRQHCHSGSSNARMADCNHYGAAHWGYDGSRLAEDEMKNGIKSNGGVGHCSYSYEAVTWQVPAASSAAMLEEFGSPIMLLL